MLSIPRYWMATVYFVAAGGMLRTAVDMADAGWPRWLIAAMAANAAMFFIGFAVHATKLALGAWRA